MIYYVLILDRNLFFWHVCLLSSYQISSYKKRFLIIHLFNTRRPGWLLVKISNLVICTIKTFYIEIDRIVKKL